MKQNHRHIYIQHERFTISGDDGVRIGLDLGDEKVSLVSENGDKEFVFKNKKSARTLDYWEEILTCMQMAVRHAKSCIDKSRIVELPYPSQEGSAKAARMVRGRKAKAK